MGCNGPIITQKTKAGSTTPIPHIVSNSQCCEGVSKPRPAGRSCGTGATRIWRRADTARKPDTLATGCHTLRKAAVEGLSIRHNVSVYELIPPLDVRTEFETSWASRGCGLWGVCQCGTAGGYYYHWLQHAELTRMPCLQGLSLFYLVHGIVCAWDVKLLS